jgi:hypothetical protein
MFFVEIRHHKDPRRVGGQVKYIAHREEGLTDGKRELYGIGARYKALMGDEKAIRKLLVEDGRGLRNPIYFRFILTVDNTTAERFTKLDGLQSERAIRDAVEKTFHGAVRGAQGAFAIHQHGGKDRPAHPHVHALLSPRLENRKPIHISPVRLQRIKERWETEVLRVLERQERRHALIRGTKTPLEVLREPWRGRLPPQITPFRPRTRVEEQPPFGLLRARRLWLLTGARAEWARRWLLGGRPSRWQNPERATRRVVFRLASRAMPTPIREALHALRGLRDLGLRQR